MKDFRLQCLRRITLLATLISVLSSCGSGVDEHREGQTDDGGITMRDDRSEALGFYTDGGLVGGIELPASSPSHLKIFRLRGRDWGTRTLANILLTGTFAFRKHFPFGDRPQIGDMTSEHGGTLSLHASHQNGLDADVAYLRTNQVERNPDTMGENGFEEHFVIKGKLTRNFDIKRNWFLLRELVMRGGVSRVFVDPAIKRAFCNKSADLDPILTQAERDEVLRRLRPYPDHDDHFHIRVNCPANSPKCLSQMDPPPGSGCSTINTVGFDEHELDARPL